MCISCFSRIDAIGLQSMGALAGVESTLRRVRSLLRGETKVARRTAAWDESATFLRRLGHDPAALLGPRPEAPTPVAAPTPPPATTTTAAPPAREPMLV